MELQPKLQILLALLLTLTSRSEVSSSPFVSVPSATQNGSVASPLTQRSSNYIGFFNPNATPPELVHKMGFGMIDAISTAQVKNSLLTAKGSNYKVRIDFSGVMLKRKLPTDVGTTYLGSNGKINKKDFNPNKNVKLFHIKSNQDIIKIMNPYISIISAYRKNVGVIFLADEPYLNGISKSEMERGIRVVRFLLNEHGLKTMKIGVNFSSGMFDSNFAKFVDEQSAIYVEKIDRNYEHGQAVLALKTVDHIFNKNSYLEWVNTIRANRLVTYDAAGNMYTGGGIPAGANVVGFDFYLSTILEDQVHDHTLQWFASHYPNSDCARFSTMTMTRVRTSLSFFRDGPALIGKPTQDSDRNLLDALYRCRIGSTLGMLRRVAKQNKGVLFQMFSEASSNGVLEFDSKNIPKKSQPFKLVESRVLDEVIRAEKFYSSHSSELQCGLTFFVYNDAFDSNLNLRISGASNLPSVMRSIINFAAVPGHSAAHACD